MSTIVVLVIIAIIVFGVITALGKNTPVGKGQTPINAKRVLTMNEQPTFNRLREALPGYIVLAQVAFSALITTKGQATRNRFNRKVADFVVLDKAYNVVAIIELDDSSHKGKEDKDANRDKMLEEAGYKVIRYKRTPDLDKVKADFNITSITQAPTTSIPADEEPLFLKVENSQKQ